MGSRFPVERLAAAVDQSNLMVMRRMRVTQLHNHDIVHSTFPSQTMQDRSPCVQNRHS